MFSSLSFFVDMTLICGNVICRGHDILRSHELICQINMSATTKLSEPNMSPPGHYYILKLFQFWSNLVEVTTCLCHG